MTFYSITAVYIKKFIWQNTQDYDTPANEQENVLCLHVEVSPRIPSMWENPRQEQGGGQGRIMYCQVLANDLTCLSYIKFTLMSVFCELSKQLIFTFPVFFQVKELISCIFFFFLFFSFFFLFLFVLFFFLFFSIFLLFLFFFLLYFFFLLFYFFLF